MVQFLSNKQELMVESDSEEAISSESDSVSDEDAATTGCDDNASQSQVHDLVKTITLLEFWPCPSFHCKSQWIQDTSGASHEQEFYIYYHLSLLMEVIELLLAD
jgi:hypothetical protein